MPGSAVRLPFAFGWQPYSTSWQRGAPPGKLGKLASGAEHQIEGEAVAAGLVLCGIGKHGGGQAAKCGGWPPWVRAPAADRLALSGAGEHGGGQAAHVFGGRAEGTACQRGASPGKMGKSASVAQPQ